MTLELRVKGTAFAILAMFNCVCIKTHDKDRYNDFETLEIRPRLCSKAEVVKALFQIISCSAIEREGASRGGSALS